jgi:hypothetical protein
MRALLSFLDWVARNLDPCHTALKIPLHNSLRSLLSLKLFTWIDEEFSVFRFFGFDFFGACFSFGGC